MLLAFHAEQRKLTGNMVDESARKRETAPERPLHSRHRWDPPGREVRTAAVGRLSNMPAWHRWLAEVLGIALLALVGASSLRLEPEATVLAQPALPNDHEDGAECLLSEAALEEDKLGEEGHDKRSASSPNLPTVAAAAWELGLVADLLPGRTRATSIAPDVLATAVHLAARQARGPPLV